MSNEEDEDACVACGDGVDSAEELQDILEQGGKQE